jgi:hypothetical protein
VALFRRKLAGTVRVAGSEDVRHLEAFAKSRRGVEGYVEPRTTVTSTTVALVAHDGEWTRRRVNDARAAADLGKRVGIPIYDVQIVGYPPRMREWSRKHQAGHVQRGGAASEPQAELPPL